MNASTMLPVVLAFFGQTDATAQSNGLPAQPVQIAPDDGPSLYGGQLSPSQLPKQPGSNNSVYGQSQATISDQPQGTVPLYGGKSFDQPAGGSSASVYGGRSTDQPSGIDIGTRPGSGNRPSIVTQPGIGSAQNNELSPNTGLPSGIGLPAGSGSSAGNTSAADGGFPYGGGTANIQAAQSRPAQSQPAFRDFSNGSTSISDQAAAPAFGGSQGFQQFDSRSAQSDTAATRNIARTSAETPLTPVHTSDNRPANRLLAQSVQIPAGEGLAGQPVTLEQAIAKTTTAAGRKQAISDYWNLAVAMREYYLAVRETRFLVGLPIPQSTHQKAVLNAAQTAAAADERKAQLTALNAQHDLSGSAALATTELPLPADTPFIGAYRTHFDTLRARDAVPARLGRIDSTLPVVLQLVDSQAEAIIASEQAVNELNQAYSSGQVSLTRLLEAHTQLRTQRREFLASVGKYNQQIAEYAITVAGNRLNSQRIVGMLIEKSQAGNSVLADRNQNGDIRRVSNVESVINPTPRNAFQR